MTTANLEEKRDFCRAIEGSGSGLGYAVGLCVRLQPRSSKNEVVGPYSGALKIRVKSAPVDGAANAALVAFLAKLLKRPKSSITILSGHRSKEKRLKIEGVTLQAVRGLLTTEAD